MVHVLSGVARVVIVGTFHAFLVLEPASDASGKLVLTCVTAFAAELRIVKSYYLLLATIDRSPGSDPVAAIVTVVQESGRSHIRC